MIAPITLTLLSLVVVSYGADFTAVNNCDFDIWMEGRYQDGPIPGESSTLQHLNSGERHGYNIPSSGLPATRFWAKFGCDSQGRNCRIGDQDQYWPGGGCPPGGCTPPIDSLFEATWGASGGTTWFDTSAVDGYTIPYIVNLTGNVGACDNGAGLDSIDGSQLDLDKCPGNTDISDNGAYPSVNANGQTFSTRNVDLKYRDSQNTLGCASPCSQFSHIWNLNPGSLPAIYYCCPTPNPNNCQISQGCITSAECRAGPASNDQYTEGIHQMTENIYAYAYDDGVGLHTCPAGTVQYTMTFCPPGSANYPGSL
eukprot:TRINITY_DN758_c0_g1_i1.p1 TRINITY_DN758_c0_g1~~TRINITY_DN758_c0_g1_i1.p1  ORF type:complete len:311 (+),score=86.83 TRINITY_DN758_c0_g1_i1:48-980(+)